jgi:hypothetical protein
MIVVVVVVVVVAVVVVVVVVVAAAATVVGFLYVLNCGESIFLVRVISRTFILLFILLF